MTNATSIANPQAKKQTTLNAKVGSHLHSAQERATTIVPTAGARTRAWPTAKPPLAL